MEIKNRKTIRLKQYDYSQPGYYFVTICVKDRACCFGNVKNGGMVLNEFGQIAKKYWQDIPLHFKNTKLDVFQMMPNHLHGIVVIENQDAPWRVPTKGIHSLIPNSLSSIINQYKGSVKRFYGKIGFKNFEWQPRYHDHIIRADESLDKIREYIKNNPKQWELDELNPNKSP